MRGTMQEVRPGVWQLRAYDRTTRRQLRRTVTGGKRDAQSALSAFVAEVNQGRVPTSSGLTVTRYLEQWLDHIRPTRQPGTVRSYEGRARRISEDLGSVRLSRLTTQQVDRFYARLAATGMTPATIRMHHAVLSTALRQAVKWGLLPTSPTDNASPPRVERYRARPLEVGALHELLQVAQATNPILTMAILLAAITGCRRGELCGLRWTDVDHERELLHVKRAVKVASAGRELVVGSTKTHQIRQVSLDTTTVGVIDSYRREAEERAADARVVLAGDGYILSTDPSGAKPLNPNVLTRAFLRLTERVGVDCRFHDLRHFSASQLIGAGHDPVVVAGRLGHDDPTTTLKIYSHALAQRDRDAARALGALVLPPVARHALP